MIDHLDDYLSRQFIIDVDLRRFQARSAGHVASLNGRRFALAGIATRGIGGLAEAYRDHGKTLTRHLIGQYSAAVIDPQERVVLLAQSSLGLGRAYWWRRGDRLLLSSDLLTIAACSGTERPDADYFARWLSHRPILERTPFTGIRQLTFGQTMLFGPVGAGLIRPWQPQPRPFSGDPEATLKQCLDDAVRFYLPNTETSAAEATVMEVSGGTDSSLVAATAVARGARLHGLSYVSDRGTTGDDEGHSQLLCDHLRIERSCLDPDHRGMSSRLHYLPDQPGRCRYLDVLDQTRRVVASVGATRMMTGVGGDLVFDYRGLVPAFLADPMVAFRPVEAFRLARRYAQERGGVRGAMHFLRYVGLPWTLEFLKGRNLAEHPDHQLPDWLAPSLKALLVQNEARLPMLAPAIRLPSARYLWDSLFVLCAMENDHPYYGPNLEVVHPLLHRPLVEFLLSLDPETRRGIPGDRRLQRSVMRGLVPDAIVERTSKGSSQMLRELHVQEASGLLAQLRQDSRLVERGWVDPEPWRRAVDLAAVGSSPHFAQFAAAVEAELWLRALEEHGVPDVLSEVVLV